MEIKVNLFKENEFEDAAVVAIQTKPALRKIVMNNGIIEVEDKDRPLPLTNTTVFRIEKTLAPEFFKGMAEIYEKVYKPQTQIS